MDSERGNGSFLGISYAPSPCHVSADGPYTILHMVLAPSFASLLQYAFLRGFYAIHYSPLSPLPDLLPRDLPCGSILQAAMGLLF